MEFLRRFIPEWGPVRWTVTVLAVLVLVLSGISLFHQPAYEVLYSPTYRCLSISEDESKLIFCTIEVGNTGGNVQEDVKFRFLREAMDHAVIPPSARNFGVSHRPITISNEQATTVISIGRLEPEKRVKLDFSLSYKKGDALHTWEEVFEGVEVTKGRVRKGDPGMTMVGRAWFNVFGGWL